MLENYVPKRALVVTAHPDDAEYTMAGTVALWAAQGCAVCYVLCTRGDCGSNDASATPWNLARIREREQQAACRILGVEELVFLNHPDGTLEPTLALRRDITREIRRFRPDVVLAGDPTVRYYGDGYLNHPDHRAAASAALDAVFPSAETRYIFPELLAQGYEPHRVHAVYIHGALEPNLRIDISSVVALKHKALAAHASQVSAEEIAEREREMALQGGTKRRHVYETYRVIVLNGEAG